MSSRKRFRRVLFCDWSAYNISHLSPVHQYSCNCIIYYFQQLELSYSRRLFGLLILQLAFFCQCPFSPQFIFCVIPNYNQQDATLLDLFTSTDAVRVSGGSSAHHQGHITVHTASGIVNQYCCLLLSWMRWIYECQTPHYTIFSHHFYFFLGPNTFPSVRLSDDINI